jgi:ABC-type nitrate/sulfonate/bicarbonate transport system substrate-binding protein
LDEEDSVKKCMLILLAAALGTAVFGAERDVEVIRVALDWTPNTNHTGLLVAQAEGFFAEAGLELRLLEPDPTVAVPLVAVGRAEFGIASQEYITMARASGIPIVSVAALYPHNTSGFASPTNRNIASPRDFSGKTYAGWGTEMEELMIRTVMEGDGMASGEIVFIDIGTIDFTTAVRLDVADFYWIFYGWQGVHAELLGIEFDFLALRELADVLDYYTPVLFASEEFLAAQPDVVKAFLAATARGYVEAALDPDSAAEHLLSHAPELDRELVVASQRWLASESTVDMTTWGYQEPSVWSSFAAWALEMGLIEAEIEADAAFSNSYLPGAAEDG